MIDLLISVEHFVVRSHAWVLSFVASLQATLTLWDMEFTNSLCFSHQGNIPAQVLSKGHLWLIYISFLSHNRLCKQSWPWEILSSTGTLYLVRCLALITRNSYLEAVTNTAVLTVLTSTRVLSLLDDSESVSDLLLTKKITRIYKALHALSIIIRASSFDRQHLASTMPVNSSHLRDAAQVSSKYCLWLINIGLVSHGRLCNQS